jgi:drug/metabolite transporter (DMT)-like permease
MRVAVPAFGPVALVFLRVAGAALVLVPLLALRGELASLRRHWRTIAVVGFVNSALPFLCFAYAALTINAGVSAIFNSATPLFAAIVAWLWLGDRMTPLRIVGLAIGFAGVLWIGWDKADFGPGGSAAAIGACLLATMSYGIGPSLTKRRLGGVPPLAVAAGSQVAASLFLAVPAALAWPAQAPSGPAWVMVALLAFFGTGLAYLLYFRLIANAGPANAVAVTYLIPIFAVVWGGIFLGERLTLPLVAGCAVIFIGTALATGMLPRASPRRALSAES